jgi:hypothetical protein
MAAVKKAQAENKTGTKNVTVSVASGPIHHAGRHYQPGDTLEVSEEVAAALVAAKLVTAAKGAKG